jgi:hypothetical protein
MLHAASPTYSPLHSLPLVDPRGVTAATLEVQADMYYVPEVHKATAPHASVNGGEQKVRQPSTFGVDGEATTIRALEARVAELQTRTMQASSRKA